MASQLISSGADVLTTGNHVFKRFDTENFLDETPCLLRPANYPPETAGNGSVLLNICGVSVLTVNIMGTSFMEPLSCPFRCADPCFPELGKYNLLVDFTRKQRVKRRRCIFLTAHYERLPHHTHVRRRMSIYSKGTAFITDLACAVLRKRARSTSRMCYSKTYVSKLSDSSFRKSRKGKRA